VAATNTGHYLNLNEAHCGGAHLVHLPALLEAEMGGLWATSEPCP
jgi:hypothetical protein